MKSPKNVKIEQYDKTTPATFRRIKKQLSSVLPEAEIHHVGSTAVPNLGGKNFLDVLVVCPEMSNISEVKAQIELLGFEFMEGVGDEERLFFKKKEETWIHIHLTWKGTREEKSILWFRDFLRSNPKEADRYYKAKQKFIKRAGGDRREYKKLKAKYIENLIKIS